MAEGRGVLGEIFSLQGACDRAEPLLVESFEKIVAEANHNAEQQALDRLRAHFERCGRPEAVAPFAARLVVD